MEAFVLVCASVLLTLLVCGLIEAGKDDMEGPP